MRSLSALEAQEWCQGHSVAVKDGRPLLGLQTQSVPIPADAGERIALVNRQTASFDVESEVLVWFTDWGVWPSAERPHIFERFRASFGESRSLTEIPSFLFPGAELEAAISFVTLGVLFLWDVDVIGASGKRALHYSHDEIVDVVVP
ncbi:MAG: hypothetical protein AB2L09_08180 [Coriobacteriia bacterium]